MKKKTSTPVLVISILFVLSIAFPITVYAGEVNSAEQKIINAISQTYTYNGGYYKVTDAYIAKVSEYLSRDDVDMTETDAQQYVSQFEANISVGIAEGYMEKTGDVENAGDAAGTETESPQVAEKSETKNSDKAASSKNNQETSESGESRKEEASSSAEGGNASATVSESGTSADSTGTASKTAQGTDLETGQSAAEGLPEGTEDNTIGSTVDGDMEYTVFPVDGELMYVWNIDSLNVHSKAYKDSEIIGTLDKGDEVTVTGAATTGWAQIDYNGGNGYVSAVYLTVNAPEGLDAIAEADAEEEKDYSDAEPLKKRISLGKAAVVLVIVVFLALCAVVLRHKMQQKNRTLRQG